MAKKIVKADTSVEENQGYKKLVINGVCILESRCVSIDE